MGLIHLPFLRGQDESVDAKIAPLGVLKSAKNVRFDRQGRVIKRPGFDVHPVVSQASGASIADPNFSAFGDGGIKALFGRDAEKVAIGGDRVCSYSETLDTWRDWNPVTPWSAPERHELGRDLVGRSFRPSVAYANGYICVCFEATGSSSNVVHAVVYDAATMALVAYDRISANAKRPRLVVMGNRFILVHVDVSGAPAVLKLSTFDTTSVTSGWTATVSIVTGTALSAEYFDLCAGDATSAFVVHVAAGNFVAAKFDSVGTVTASAALAGTGVPTIYASATRVMVGWLTALGALTVRSYNTSFGASTGPTVLATAATHQGQPIIGATATSSFRVCVSEEDAAPDHRLRSWAVDPTTHANSEDSTANGFRSASKIAQIGNRSWAWVVNKSTFDRTYFLRSFSEEAPFTTVARGQAVDFADSDNHVSEFVSYTSGGSTFALWAAPVVASGDASNGSPLTAVDLVRIELGGTERFQGAVIGGNLYFTAGLLTMFDGALAHEAGFLETPRFLSGVPGVGGSMTPSSTYQYLLTNHWLDANGQLHLSGVSDPLIVTLGAGDGNVTLGWQRPRQSWRWARWKTNVNVPDFRVRQHLWRTEANGTIFHQLTDELGYSVPVTGSVFGAVGTVADTAADAAIASRAVVYTQGARGALSGPLQHDPPPPCKYLWAGRERAIVGGLERPNEVRWSKFYFPGEALEFSEDAAFRKLVPGTVRAVASLDDTWVVFTDTQLFVVTGQGPDDTGAGQFDEPRALPSDVGIRTWRSLVEWSGGLFFQGKSDMLYLLPRGIGSPVAQTATQAPLRLYPTVTSARLVTESNLVVFTLTGGAGGTGALLCFDTETGQWTVDEIAGGAQHGASAVVSDRLLLATADGTALDVENPSSYVDRSTTFVSVQLETAWLRPHGMQADGRTRKVGVLGEYQADCSLQMQLAVDDTPSYAYTKTWALGAATPGTPLRREWDVPVQKFGSMQLKVREVQTGTLKNAGFVLHGITLDTRARPGMPRLSQGRR